MATNLEVIGDALRELNVISEIDVPSAEQGAHGLRKLNEMMDEWAENDIELEYFTQDDPTEDCPLQAYALNGVKANLAVAIAPTYGASVSPELALKASNGYDTILRRSINSKLQPADMSHMPVGEGQTWRSNIETDD